MILRTFLRTKLHPLHVTSVEATEESFPGSICLCPRLCWAAQLAELEQVEVASLSNGVRFSATVLIGETGEVRIPAGDLHGFDPGDWISVTACAQVPATGIAEHMTAIVLVDQRRNAAVEIRRQAVRPILREPSFTPLLLRKEQMAAVEFNPR